VSPPAFSFGSNRKVRRVSDQVVHPQVLVITQSTYTSENAAKSGDDEWHGERFPGSITVGCR